jgi:hypothetical protein
MRRRASAWRKYNYAPPESECIHRVGPGTEQGECDHVEAVDDVYGCPGSTQSEPDESTQEQPDRCRYRRQISCKQSNDEQYGGSVKHARQSLSVSGLVDQQTHRDGRPQDQQANPGQSWGEHGEEPLHTISVLLPADGAKPIVGRILLSLLGDPSAARTR